MTDTELAPPGSRSSPLDFLRDIRFLKFIAQAVFLILVLAVGAWLINNLLEALDARGLNLSFDFFNRTAGFNIGEGLPMERTDSFWRAFLVGLVNSIRVILVGLLLATIVGVLAGIALLSPNFLLRNMVGGYVEIMRNTPLLVQLFFIYFAVILTLPSLQERIQLGPFSLSQRGFYFPKPVPQESFPLWLAVFLTSLVLSALAYALLLRRRIQRGIETRPGLWSGLILIVPPLLVWLFLPGNPLTLESPAFDGVQQISGSRLTPEFAAILLGLVLYTAAFIADIVRSGIMAVPKGQTEAATAVGLTKMQVLRLVILPQALRVIIPPLTNQYLNLAKNSSLAVGVGFPDLYNISSTIFNQSGQAVQVITLMMGTYLAMSLLISAVMNFINDRLKIPER
jgi:general L-amino acid transport system permease protein